MVWWQAMILGLVQGFTEFLPVSSSGHLIVVREIMGLSGDGGVFLLFDVVVHVGTLAAVVIVLFGDIIGLFKKPYKRLAMLAVATVPAVVVGFLCKDIINEYFSTAKFIGFFFLFTAVILFAGELVAKKRAPGKELGWGSAITMGLMQGIGVFPGVSRSGSTIFGGVVTGADRKQVATFSFLMSIPVIAGSLLLSVIDVAKSGALVGVEPFSMFIGAASAFASGYFSVRFMLALISKADFKWFSVYLGILSIVLLSIML